MILQSDTLILLNKKWLMKVKWRKHEIITVTILVTIGVMGLETADSDALSTLWFQGPGDY